MSKDIQMDDKQRAMVKEEIRRIEHDYSLKYLRETHYHYYLELCLRTNQLPQ